MTYVHQGSKAAGTFLMDDTSMKFAFIEQTEQEDSPLTIGEMCALSGVSRSGYYAWKAAAVRKEREEQDRADFDLILKAYNMHGFSKGARGIHMALLHLEEPVVMNIKKIWRLMHKYHLVCPIRKPSPYKQMAKALAESRTAPNILARDFGSYGPRTILLTDITYLPIQGGSTNAYLSAVPDAYTKEILGWVCRLSMDTPLTTDTLARVSSDHGSELGEAVLVHSDQGTQYTSCAFREALRNQNFIQSMSRRGNCWDNQPMEYFFSSLKDHISERLIACSELHEVNAVVQEYIDYYNDHRYQWKLAKLAPAEFYRFCMSGEYPLALNAAPERPVPVKGPDDLRRSAGGCENVADAAG